MGPTGSGPLLNFTSGARTARSTYLINEPAIIQVPGRNVSFGNRSGPPIVDQLSARDGSGADVKFNSERHERDTARTGEWLRMRNSTAKTGPRPLPGPSAAHSSPAEVGSFSSPGRRSPTRFLVASGAGRGGRPDRRQPPRLKTPARVNSSRTDTPDRSLSRCPPEAAVDVDLPHHNHDAGSRRDLTHNETYAWRTTGGRTTSAVRGPA